MKSVYLILTIALCNSMVVASPKEQRVPSTIKHVTVFLSGAEIERNANVRLGSGTTNIVFTDLSNNVNEASIQVSGKGNFTILSVSKKRNFLNKVEEQPEYKKLSDSLKLAKDELWVQQELKKVYQQEYELLMANKKIDPGTQGGFSTQDIKELSAFYSNKLKSLMKQRMEATRTEAVLQEKINRFQNQLNQMVQVRKYSSEVTVEVLADAPTQANFELKYLVSGANWRPTYNVRATSNDKEVEVSYNAKITQTTGIEWENVSLTLSTANPSVSPIMPTLTPWRLNLYNRQFQGGASYSNRAFTMERESSSVKESFDLAKVPSAGTIAQQVTLDESQLNLNYNIKIPYTIPNDGIAHSINIKNMDMPAEFKYYTTPKLMQKAYLIASIKDWEKYSLIDGEANVYFDDTYVGKTQLSTNSTDKDLKVSMGVDQQVIITRNRVEDYCEKQTIGSNKKETIGIKVSIKNAKMRAIDLEIIEQIPISSNDDIEVELLESSNAKHNKENGELRWNATLQPGQTNNFIFMYQVKYPKDKHIPL